MPIMPGSDDHAVYVQVTETLAATMSLVRDGHRTASIARRRNVSRSTVRTQIAHLEAITGCRSIDELADWWREHDQRWLANIAARTGVSLPSHE